MVKAKHILLIIALVIYQLGVKAQSFPISDTTTEYPHKGTYYHDRFEGRKTANGEVFDQNLFTAAHWRIKLGTMVMVTNQNTGLQVIVKINDRCPRHGVLDMTHRAANAIGIKGCQPVTVRILPEGYEEQWASQDGLFDSVYSTLTGTPQTTLTNKLPPLVSSTQKKGERYNLVLCSVADHGQGFNQIMRLPYDYQDKIVLEPMVGSDSLQLVLDVKYSQQQASDLSKAMQSKFPQCKVVLAY